MHQHMCIINNEQGKHHSSNNGTCQLDDFTLNENLKVPRKMSRFVSFFLIFSKMITLVKGKALKEIQV